MTTGARMPQPCLADGTRLSDAMAGRFAILGSRQHLGKLPVSLSSGESAICIERESHPEIEALLAIKAADMLIVRPDFYCFARVSEGRASDGTRGVQSALATLAEQVSSDRV